jgi:hypothetical protein
MNQHKSGCAITVNDYFPYLHDLMVKGHVKGDSANMIWTEVLSVLIEPLASSWSIANDTIVERGAPLLQIGLVTDILKLTSAPTTNECPTPSHQDDSRRIAGVLHLFLIMTSPHCDLQSQDWHKCSQYHKGDVLAALESHFIDSCTSQRVSTTTPSYQKGQTTMPKFPLVAWLICKQGYNPPITFLQCLSKIVRSLISENYPWHASYGMDILFRSLLERDQEHPYNYPEAPFDARTQKQKLLIFVDILASELQINGLRAHWEVLLGPWTALLRGRYSDFLKRQTGSEDNRLPEYQIHAFPETNMDEYLNRDSESSANDDQWPFALRPIIEPEEQYDPPNQHFYLGKVFRHLDYLQKRYTPSNVNEEVVPMDGSNSVRPSQFTALDEEIQEVGARFDFLNRYPDAAEPLLKQDSSVLAVTVNADSQV